MASTTANGDLKESGEAPAASADQQAQAPAKEIIVSKVKGQVKWFNVKRGYGFVHRFDNDEDLFIHQTAITASNPNSSRRSVGENEEIEFDVVSGAKGYEAHNVTGPGGAPVQGSRYAVRYGGGRGRRGRRAGGASYRNRQVSDSGRVRSHSADETTANSETAPTSGRGAPNRGGRGGRRNMRQQMMRAGGMGGGGGPGARPFMIQYRGGNMGAYYDNPPMGYGPPPGGHYMMPYDRRMGPPPAQMGHPPMGGPGGMGGRPGSGVPKRMNMMGGPPPQPMMGGMPPHNAFVEMGPRIFSGRQMMPNGQVRGGGVPMGMRSRGGRRGRGTRNRNSRSRGDSATGGESEGEQHQQNNRSAKSNKNRKSPKKDSKNVDAELKNEAAVVEVAA